MKVISQGNIALENVNVKPRDKTYREFKKIIDCENIRIMKV
jgi:hypothetical protein